MTLPLFDGTRPLKRWRYVGVFNEQLMRLRRARADRPARQSFWALHLREEGLAARAHAPAARDAREVSPARRPRLAVQGPGRLRVCDRGVQLELELHEDEGIEALCPNGALAGMDAQAGRHRSAGHARARRRPHRPIEARAVIDDTAGYHARDTEWRWSAGVGEGADGRALAWNLVSGVNDPPSGTERAVWVDGHPTARPRRSSFAADLSSVRCADGSELRFSGRGRARPPREPAARSQATTERRSGPSPGTLPGGIELAHGSA